MVEPPTIGDVAKNAYDGIFIGIGKRLWKGSKQVFDSNFGKGVIVAALGIIAVMALVSAWMGATGKLSIDGIGSPSIENAMKQGVFHAISFLVSPVGIGTLIAGGLAGSYLMPKMFSDAPVMNVEQAKAKAADLSAARSLQPEITADVPPSYYSSERQDKSSDRKTR